MPDHSEIIYIIVTVVVGTAGLITGIFRYLLGYHIERLDGVVKEVTDTASKQDIKTLENRIREVEAKAVSKGELQELMRHVETAIDNSVGRIHTRIDELYKLLVKQ